MTLPVKSSRRITVGSDTYRWIVSPDSGSMWVIVEREDTAGQRLQAQFDYHDALPSPAPATQRQRITPASVRRVIELALRRGWCPAQPHLPPFRLDDAEAMIDALP